jgi:hypothetical protein
MKSGDRVDTGTGGERRPLTLAESEAGELPEPLTTDEWAAMHRASTGTEAERGAAVDHAEQVVLTAAVALIEWYDEVYADTQKQRLRAAVAALKAAEVAS